MSIYAQDTTPVGNSLNRLWRTFGFTISYPFFAAGCVLLALAAPLSGISVDKPQQRVRRMRLWAHSLARGYLNLVTFMGLVRVDWPDQHELPPGLIVANHPSLVDAVWILASQRDIALVLKGDLERFKVVRYLVARLGYVSNSDPEKLLDEGVELLRQGERLLVFPEATRSEPGQLLRFRLGAAELAIRAQVAVHPIVIFKHGEYLSKSCPWYAFPNDKLRWRMRHAKSIDANLTTPPRQARRELNGVLQEFFRGQLAEPVVALNSGEKEN